MFLEFVAIPNPINKQVFVVMQMVMFCGTYTPVVSHAVQHRLPLRTLHSVRVETKDFVLRALEAALRQVPSAPQRSCGFWCH